MARANLKRLEEGKLYYSISEVCSMTGLEQHVLRYWESEFPQLRPKKNRSGNRAYRSKEIKIIRYIKYLLYDELYTIPGAKKKMADANMADLEGQMSLIRMPASPVSARQALPAAGAVLETATEEEENTGSGENPESATGEFDGGGQEAVPEGHDFQESAPGPESAAAEERLRGELLQLREELKRLLADLKAAGGMPGTASLAASTTDSGGVSQRRTH